MAYYLDLFSPETYEKFSQSSQTVSGFRQRQRNVAERIKPGDILVCYMTKLSRWIGLLEVTSESFEDNSPIFYEQDDPFVIRFRVKPIVWLEKEHAVPIKSPDIWNQLSFTREHEQGTSAWTGKLRASLNQIDPEDGQFLEEVIHRQASSPTIYPVNEDEYKKLVTHQVRLPGKTVSVTVPEDPEGEEDEVPVDEAEVRESIQIQALLARIGVDMGMRIWAPNQDRGRIIRAWGDAETAFLPMLPLSYDETTLKTIEQIDLLWLRGRSIVRAFEVEHTTSIYSGMLRMADLLALQPNMDIKLHIVAPEARREKVFRELRRPVFSLLERGPLYETCTYLSYDSIREVARLRHLPYLSDSVLEEYAEEAE
jgi:predicted RNA-binding protein